LRESLAALLEAGAPVPALRLIAVAAYFPLDAIPDAKRLLQSPWSAPVAAILAQQISEPEEERKLRATLPRLNKIENRVSRLVQTQYEENPYPRWIKAAPAGPKKSVVRYLCEKFPLATFDRHGKPDAVDILIAGCGTGQQSIETARRFDGARVLAIDLSKSSLGYAMRKTRELGLSSIDYAEADILGLAALDRRFDVVEAVGVLHHLADPLAGWRALLSLLHPGGFMRVGLYSALARRNVLRIRTLIAERGIAATADDIRRFRQELIDLNDQADFGTTVTAADFFTISECRDFLFHVQEQGMRLTEIEVFLQENNLIFLGFEIDGAVLEAYRQRFPEDRAATNLRLWRIFESENPDTFLGMYHFWIQNAPDTTGNHRRDHPAGRRRSSHPSAG
jgi:2-polyprenyl-3-methyl-5-hydroxy-6-metoxy-1,4-benzoquinol methylase